MNRDAAVRLVNAWIERYRLYLKDGGGAAGVHAVPKEALIAAIAEAFASVPIVPPAPPSPPEPAAAPRRRGRPAKADQPWAK